MLINTEKYEKRAVIISTALMCGLSFVLVGPSQIFGFPDSIVLMGIGMALVGVFNPAGIIMGLPEMEEASLEKYHKS